MTDEKRNRIIAAVTVNVILLIVILTAVVIYQLVTIVTVKSQCEDIKQQIEENEKKTSEDRQTLEYWQSQKGLEDLAYKYGFVSGK